MVTLIDVLKVIYINTILMANLSPLSLPSSNVCGHATGDRADTYTENITKNRAILCFFFHAIAYTGGGESA